MNDFLSLIYTRRSNRNYTSDKIKKKDLEEVIKAGLCAPSGRNKQVWQFTVLINEKKKARLAQLLNREERFLIPKKNFYGAPAFIIVSTPRNYKYGEKDTACAIENMLLATHSKNLGGVWINQLNRHVDKPHIRKILNEFEIPSNHIVHGSMALGYPKKINRTLRKNKGKVKFID